MKRAVTVVLILLVSGTCVRLGFWQLDRLGERRRANATIERRRHLAALDLNHAWPEDSAEHRTGVVAGVFDWDREVIEVGRPLRGVPGVYVVTPMVLPDGRAVLVQRGWMPSVDARSVRLDAVREADTAVVRGVLLSAAGTGTSGGDTWPLSVRRADPHALGSRYPYPLFPLLLRRTDPPRTASGGVLRRVPLPPLGLGPHLGYAVQWFVFAGIAILGPSFVYLSERRKRRFAPPVRRQTA